MKVNLGSGFKRYEGFVNVDSDPITKPDYVVDLEKDPLPFADNTVKEIRAYHILEHIGLGFFPLLQEMYRVCEHNAIIDIHVPHHRHDYFFGDPSHIRPITLEMMDRFDQQKNRRDLANDPGSTPFGISYGVDFEVIWHHYQLEPFFEEQFKTMTPDQINMTARMYNNVIQELHMKLRVRKNGT